MAYEPLLWYCRPLTNGVWAKVVDESAFGAYTACAIESLVISVSHLVLFCLVAYRIWLINRSSEAQRFRLGSNYYNYMLAFLAAYCTADALLRLLMSVSIFNLDGETSLAPFEVCVPFIFTIWLLFYSWHFTGKGCIRIIIFMLSVCILYGLLCGRNIIFYHRL